MGKPDPPLYSSDLSKWRPWVPPVLMSLAILTLSGDLGSTSHTLGILVWVFSELLAFSPEGVDLAHVVLRKAGHFLAYGICGLLWFRAFAYYHPGRLVKNAALALGLSLAVALLDEGHQSWVASRSGSLADVALDMFGATSLVMLATLRKRKSRK